MLIESLSSKLSRALRDASSELDAADGMARTRLLSRLVSGGLARLPRPGSGATLERWQALALVASRDLSLVKLYEGHTDAIAILAEAGLDEWATPGTWGMWAAEAPGARVTFVDGARERCELSGTKAWCSGARGLDRALLTVWGADGSGPFLAAVDLRQPGVSFDSGHWQAVGMAATDSCDVHFAGVPATLVGPARFYLERPGFWQGGVGIAACWHGGACAVADALRLAAKAALDAGWHRLLALGAVDTTLAANAALLRETAAWIDAHPQRDAQQVALRTRAACDAAAERVLRHATRALGAAPLCRDASFARMAADLPVFIRQSHADRDLVALGQQVVGVEESAWTL